MADPRQRAAIYTRISRDREGQSVGVGRQEADCRELAERRGYEVVRVYTDNDVSASELTKTVRPEFEQMYADATAGHFDLVLAYSNSRLTRRLAEFERLVDLNSAHKVEFRTVVSGDFDLSTTDGLMTARILASVDAAEARRTGERLRAAHHHLAMSGKPFLGGHRAFGWAEDKMTVVPAEAELIRQAATAIVNGTGSLSGIAKAWNVMGVRTSKGNEWRHTTLRGLLVNPRLAGYRTHRGEVLKRPDGELVRGEWEPILTDDERDRLLVALENRKGSRRRAARYPLTRFLMCGRCGARMYGSRKDEGKSFYRCSRKWHLTVNAAQLERAVSTQVGMRVGMIYEYDLEHGQDRPDEPGTEPEFAGADRLASLQKQNEELMERYNLGLMKGERVFPQVEANDREIEELTAAQRRWRVDQMKAKTPALPVSGGFDLSVWWKLFQEDTRSFLTNLAIERIVVKPTGKGRRLTVDERLDIAWTPGFTPWPEGHEPEPQAQDLAWLKWEAASQDESRPKVVSENQKAVMNLVRETPNITGAQVAERLGISRPYAQNLLRRARQEAAGKEDGRASVPELTAPATIAP